MTSSVDEKKIILVIGGTGAQGLAVINSLLEPCADGSPSPYAIRTLTRDPASRRAQELSSRGVECVKGSFDDLVTVVGALEGMYGAWVNTDGFTVGEQKEVWAGLRIFELAKQDGAIRHYVWSSLDYSLKAGTKYRCEHYDGKARVADWMRSQPSDVGADGMAWTIVTSGPYMDMLFNMMFGPLKRRADGTAVFATPVGDGHVPMVALADLGFFARYTFDHREETSGTELKIASDMVGWEYLARTFEKVTGQKAVVVHQTLDEWFGNFEGVDDPVANERKHDGSTTWRENFSGWWKLWRDDVISRDMSWPGTYKAGCKITRNCHAEFLSGVEGSESESYAYGVVPVPPGREHPRQTISAYDHADLFLPHASLARMIQMAPCSAVPTPELH
ncbi:NAD(P)-binding protein [Fomes fomentarius]|nr:NAD(P)-binding protein [Fomes fomentarius]